MTEIKEKFKELGRSFRDMADKAKCWAYNNGNQLLDFLIEHPEATAAVVVPLGVAGIRTSQSLIVSHRENKAAKRQDRSWYDPSTGFRWDLKRKMSNNDRVYVVQAKQNGKSSLEALIERGLI